MKEIVVEIIHHEDVHQGDLLAVLLAVLEDLLHTHQEEDLQVHVIGVQNAVDHQVNHLKEKEVPVNHLHQNLNLVLV